MQAARAADGSRGSSSPMVTYGSLAAQIELEAARATRVAPPLLPFPADLLLGLGHIVAEGEEWSDAIDVPAADAA